MKYLLSLLLSFIAFTATSQVLEPAKWSFSKEATGENEYTLYFDVKLDHGWYVYSQFLGDDGPIPTTFHFEENKHVELIGSTEETGEKLKEGFDQIFQMNLKKFGESARFSQKVKVKKPGTVLKGYLEFMTCDDEKCLPPSEVEFSFTFEEPKNDDRGQMGILEPVKWSYHKEKLQDDEYQLVFEAHIDEGWYLYSQHIGGNEDDIRPVPTTFTFDKNDKVEFIGEVNEEGKKVVEGIDSVFQMYVKKFSKGAVFTQKIKTSDPDAVVTGNFEFMTCDNEKCLPPQMVDFSFGKVEQSKTVGTVNSSGTERSILGIFFGGFIGGLLALLTPCVFPMIPLTVSFFTKSSKTKSKGVLNALIYSISIIVIYVLLGFIVTKVLGADALNAMASNAFFNLTFFVVFIIFAISFFGYFEITLPSGLINKMDAASDRGGTIGIFFMAFTLALVSFSCTGPIIGTLLVEAAVRGHNLGPLMGMFGFSLALALPFGLFAAFPGWLNSLPKSGGWLNSVKVVLGFLELALALKFLSNVDLAYHWGILKREIFIGIWILIFAAMGLYVLGKIRFPHDSVVKKLSPLRIGLAILIFAFVIYLLPGLKGGSLKLLSGFPPPGFYSIWEVENKCPHGINCFKDFEEGMAYAKRTNKPVMIDFTGWSCVNCRKMEENVWVEPDVLKLLKEDYVLISLYVDDKTPLPEKDQKVSDCTGKKIRTVGNKWSEFQACTFNTNSQPYYVLMNSRKDLLNDPVGYTPDKSNYIEFLEKGLEAFRNGNS